MICPTLAMRRSALLLADVPDPARTVAELARALRRRLAGTDTFAQLTRFAVVGLLSSLLYAAVFVTLDSLGTLTANLIGMLTSTMLANELHRRLTFRASAAVGWLRAQLQGGGLAVIGLVATSSALLALQAAIPDAGWFLQVAMVAVITAAIGLMRFAALRAWVFSAARRARSSVPVLSPQH